jgi:hypothetical protein
LGTQDLVHPGRLDPGARLQARQVVAGCLAADHPVRTGRDRGLVDEAVAPLGVGPVCLAPRLREDVVKVDPLLEVCLEGVGVARAEVEAAVVHQQRV